MALPQGDSVWPLRVTAGTGYDPQNHQNVDVNGHALTLGGDGVSVNVAVRIQDYDKRSSNSISTHKYFNHPGNEKNKFSISLSIVFDQDVNGNDLLFGNDFDHSIAAKLPRGSNFVAQSVKRLIDPSLEIDANGEKPSIFSPALTSWSQLRLGVERPNADQRLTGETIVEEGADDDRAREIRNRLGIPDEPSDRKNHFQKEQNRLDFWFSAGCQYLADFGNSYVNFTDLSIDLPIFQYPVHQLVDSENKELRFTLKNKVTGQVYLVVIFSLDLSNEDGSESLG